MIDDLKRGLLVMTYHMAGEARAYSFPLDTANKQRIAADIKAVKACMNVINEKIKKEERKQNARQ